MDTDIWLKRVENGASQILGKLNSIEKRGHSARINSSSKTRWCDGDGAASKYEILRLVTKYTSGFTENFCMSGCRRYWRQLCREKVKPKQDSLLAGSTDGGQRSSRRRCGNQLFLNL